MNTITAIGILLTSLSGIFSIAGIAYYAKKSNSNILRKLFWVNLYLNAIWYSGLILQLKAYAFITDSPVFFLTMYILFSSCIFIFKFLFLIAFFKLFQQLLNLELIKQFMPILNRTVFGVIAVWLIAWLEILLFDSTGITTNLMNYTDILIFVGIIAACVYMILKVNSLPDNQTRKAIRKLSIVFIVPLVFACLKWILSGSVGASADEWLQLMLHAFVLLVNLLSIWWALVYGTRFLTPSGFALTPRAIDTAEITEKYKISKREMEVIRLICEGKSNREIAEQLFISVDTVKDHNSNIYQKTGVKNRTQLAGLFMQRTKEI